MTNTSLGRLGLTAADLSLGLCPQAVAHLERCAAAGNVEGPTGRGAGQVHCHSESSADGAERAAGRPAAFLWAPRPAMPQLMP